MERAKVSGTFELVSRYNRRDEGQSEGCHEQAEKTSREDPECDDAFGATVAIDADMLKWRQNNTLSI